MKPSDVSRHYDRLDVWYRSLWGEHLHHGLWDRGTADREEAARNLLRAVARAAGLEPSMRVCDVGCGYGGPARWLARETGAEFTAVTNSEKQFEFLKSQGGPVTPVLADWMENDFPDEAFDAVLAIESTPHFSEPARALTEMLRVLKPGGTLVIAAWVEGVDVPGWARRILLEPIRRAGEMPGLVTLADQERWLAEAGAGKVEVELMGARVVRTWSSGMGVALRALITDRALRRDALRHPLQAWRLAMSSLRIWLGYRLEVLDYAIVRVRKSAVI